jgi:hypothetical protein
MQCEKGKVEQGREKVGRRERSWVGRKGNEERRGKEEENGRKKG